MSCCQNKKNVGVENFDSYNPTNYDQENQTYTIDSDSYYAPPWPAQRTQFDLSLQNKFTTVGIPDFLNYSSHIPPIPTLPPVMTTQGPVMTTPIVVMTTQGPVMTTQVPVMTTQGPVMTTQGPVMTTQGPVMTTQGPMMTTQGPMMTTQGPVMTTEGPMWTTQAPSVTTQAPARFQHAMRSHHGKKEARKSIARGRYDLYNY